ncbi:hypothetical protein [Sphingomonas prati]|uniref:Uncharacterized protein n=1 Tax=Sphingomonas prati TaxID=1843237 RepID=A0A7W9F2G1_9SPHN|nr:hypothetical protein [Sphingomonas prati]MBB5730353.1 hypothetical protein [Sphingomonas prati]GGE93470.1 hypothetical protein GCM10011404_28050 [Sphingomonas prati]
MHDSDRVMENADAVLRRVSEGNRARIARRRARRRSRLGATSKRLALVTVALLLLMIGAGMVTPIGIGGAMLFALAAAIAWALVIFGSVEPEARVADLAAPDIARLPARTESWLEQQRPALPAPAITLVDAIGLKLDTLAPQLATLDPATPAAADLRKLIGEELPELIAGYRRVPTALRTGAARSGLNPDRQLLDGLAVVDEELARMAERIADGDLHRLATQGRFLELKYRGEGG